MYQIDDIVLCEANTCRFICIIDDILTPRPDKVNVYLVRVVKNIINIYTFNVIYEYEIKDKLNEYELYAWLL